MQIRPVSIAAAALAVAVAGCGTTTVTPAASGSPAAAAASGPASPAATASDAWLEADWSTADIAQPSAVTTAPSLPPGYQCHPCHFLAEDQLFGIGGSVLGPIAVGVEQPPAQAIAFRTSDTTHWVALPGFTGAVGSAAVAVASNGPRIVIVGHDTDGATAWAYEAGSWHQAPRQATLLVPYVAGGMTSVTPFEGGFVAGGFRDDPLRAAASAAVWRSDDGLAWTADDASKVFAGGRIWGIAADGGTLVAVGTSGDPNYGPAAVWRWTRAAGWQRGDLGPDATGAMRAVAHTRLGFVAVGLNGHDAGARVWTSPDGLRWTVMPDQPAFHFYALPVRMQSIVEVPSGLVAGGWRSDQGKGSGVVWTSDDGVRWQAAWETSFSGGQITGLTVSGGAVIAVGRTGYPDWNTATIWREPVP